jgi:phosphate starvation-inducible PhoH-like protein
MLKGHFQRMIFTRPYVEAGEKLGFLPGGSDSKFAPFVMPLFEVVSDYLGQEEIKALIEEKRIIIYPLAYMRGSTFKNSYVVADECQNMSIQQMRMMLTRLGENSKIVCTGDIEQSDLCLKTNGLADAINRLKGLPDLEFVEMGYESCVREKIVADIDLRYKNWQMGINSK